MNCRALLSWSLSVVTGLLGKLKDLSRPYNLHIFFRRIVNHRGGVACCQALLTASNERLVRLFTRSLVASRSTDTAPGSPSPHALRTTSMPQWQLDVRKKVTRQVQRNIEAYRLIVCLWWAQGGCPWRAARMTKEVKEQLETCMLMSKLRRDVCFRRYVYWYVDIYSPFCCFFFLLNS